jgi:uncharacterized repeat protein (TIGR01451 family)/CSLREA domain-containing protein
MPAALLVAITVGCTDSEPTVPAPRPTRPVFDQGDGGLWTVTSLDDPGNGTCDDVCTLREAIGAAQSGASISFANGLTGTVPLTGGQLEIIDKSISIDGGKTITVDAQGSSRVILINDAAQSGTLVVKLAGMVIKNGTTTGVFDAPTAGGGIKIDGGDVTLTDVTISDSKSAFNGGGVAVLDGSTLHFERGKILRNEATGAGGGIWVTRGTLDLANTTVADNTDHFFGGGLSNIQSSVTISGSTISGNQSPHGGGINQFAGSLTMARSTVSGNRATTTSQFGSTGGGIDVSGDAGVDLTSVTITGNTGAGGAGGQNLDVAAPATLTTSNSIIGGGGPAGSKQCALGGSVSSGGYNLFASDCAPAAPQATDIIVAGGVIYTQFVDPVLKDNGGPTKTHALLPTGLAIDAGFCPAETVDQRGSSRPADIGNRSNANDGCDIGAYELQPTAPVVADLIVSQSVDKTSVKQGDLLTYTVRVRNLGPNAASDVVVSDVLSSGVTFVEARPSKGAATAPLQGETGTVTWTVGTMENGDNQFAEIKVTVRIKGKTTITNVATATSVTTDPVSGNNSASLTTTVAAGSAAGGGGNGGKGGKP